MTSREWHHCVTFLMIWGVSGTEQKTNDLITKMMFLLFSFFWFATIVPHRGTCLKMKKLSFIIKIVSSFKIPHFYALQVSLILSHPDFSEQKWLLKKDKPFLHKKSKIIILIPKLFSEPVPLLYVAIFFWEVVFDMSTSRFEK